MNSFFKKGASVLLSTLIILGGFSCFTENYAMASSADRSLVVVGYTLSSTSVVKDMAVSAVINFKDTSLKTSELGGAENLDISRLVDDFRGGKILPESVKITSTGDEPLQFTATIANLVYSGSGRQIKIMVGYKNLSDRPYESLEIPVSEAVEYQAPEPVTPPQPEPIPAPMIVVSRNDIRRPVKANEDIEVTLNVKNIGTVTMQDPVLTITPSESLILTGTSSSYELSDIPSGKFETVRVTLKAADSIASANQDLTAEVKFNYYNRVALVQATASDKVSIPAKMKKEESEVGIDGPVPNIIVDHFGYGGESVAAGKAFNLSFRFLNTNSSISAENVVATVDGGESFSINGSSNTFYYKKLKPGQKKKQVVPMKALQTVKNGSFPVEITFKYEYVDNKKRTPVTNAVKISIPVYLPDRFEVTRGTIPEFAMTGEETGVTLNYVNKSKGDILNVQARIEGNIQSSTPVQNVGNLEAGKSGTIAMAVTPMEAGEVEFSIKVQYEDGNGEIKTREFPVTMNVEDPPPIDPGEYEEEIPEETGGSTKWIIIAAAGVAALIIAAVAIKKRKKKKASEAMAKWEDDDLE